MLDQTIDEIRELQQQRKFCIKTQSRMDRSCEAFVARSMGYRLDLPEEERVSIWKKAAALRRAVEKAGGGLVPHVDHTRDAASVCIPIILVTAQGRETWDKLRTQVEARMRVLARTLPAWEFVKGVAGFAELGLAIIVGEAGNLSNYATKERLWKRLGLAVIEGERQRKKGDAAAALVHGYSPSRRAEVWTIGDSLFRHQWAGPKEDKPAYAKGPYGEAYAKRKAATEGRMDATDVAWTPKHRDNDARRIMTKALVEDLHKAWRQRAQNEMEPMVSEDGVPAAAEAIEVA